MNLCFQCGHPAADHEPWCDCELTTLWGTEVCGCSHFQKDDSDDD